MVIFSIYVSHRRGRLFRPCSGASACSARQEAVLLAAAAAAAPPGRPPVEVGGFEAGHERIHPCFRLLVPAGTRRRNVRLSEGQQ